MTVPDLRNYRKDAISGLLRDRRGRVTPDPASPVFDPVGDRRVTGMRREEVAWAAGISLDYYVKLEQGRMLNPSPSVLAGIMGALRLGDLDRRYLRLLFGERALPVAVPSSEDNRRARAVLGEIADHFPEATMRHILDRDLDLTLPDGESRRILFPDVDDPPWQVSLVEYLFAPEYRSVSRRVYVDWREKAAEVIGLVHMKLATGAASPELSATVQGMLRVPSFRTLWGRYVPHANRVGTWRVDLGATDGAAASTVRACSFFTVTVPDDPDLSLVIYE
ncbi:helix-turn-helix domain-containing protein [uncultured Corynebacterium sp.]|uniref:MmyB family transcriptional regulator n=1 Tax=uncultured Corynebacterium sp. TaxID=159447 RepID=UPI0025FE5FDC|nr:helix-turn-helix domain-containing protein [uncultured Corynebacterium sp.]